MAAGREIVQTSEDLPGDVACQWFKTGYQRVEPRLASYRVARERGGSRGEKAHEAYPTATSSVVAVQLAVSRRVAMLTQCLKAILGAIAATTRCGR